MQVMYTLPTSCWKDKSSERESLSLSQVTVWGVIEHATVCVLIGTYPSDSSFCVGWHFVNYWKMATLSDSISTYTRKKCSPMDFFPCTMSVKPPKGVQPCRGWGACVSRWPWELCWQETCLLVGPPISERSRGRDQTKSTHWSSRLGVRIGLTTPFYKKRDCYRNRNRNSRSQLGRGRVLSCRAHDVHRWKP